MKPDFQPTGLAGGLFEVFKGGAHPRNIQAELAAANQGVEHKLSELDLDKYAAEVELEARLGRTEDIPPMRDPKYRALLQKIQSELKSPTFNPKPGETF